MHHKLFHNSQEWDTTEEAALNSFERYADELGVDGAALRRCVEQGMYADAVQRNFEKGDGSASLERRPL